MIQVRSDISCSVSVGTCKTLYYVDDVLSGANISQQMFDMVCIKTSMLSSVDEVECITTITRTRIGL